MKRTKPQMGRLLLGVVCCLPLLGCPSSLLPNLTVQPVVVNFGADGVAESLAIFNNGPGALAWTIQENIGWLTVDATSGVTSSFSTARVTLTVDRTGLTPGIQNETFQVVSSAGVETVRAVLLVSGTPVLGLSTDVINLLDQQSSALFTITNEGSGFLTWGLTTLDAADPTIPVDVSPPVTIDPIGARLAEGAHSTVTISVDRAQLETGIYKFIIRITTDVGDADIMVSITQGLGPLIAVDPPVLDFGTTLNTLILTVFNDGPGASTLNFTARAEPDDLIMLSTDHGTSPGSNDPNIRYAVPITVSINRDQIQGDTDGGTIFIEAPGLDTVALLVSVKPAPLSFEGAMNRSRPPFIMRFVFLMRDGDGKAIDTLNPTILNELQTAFSVDEDGLPLDRDESNVFVTSAQNMRYDVALLLDYTGSMYAALHALNPGSSDALQQLYAGSPTNPDDGLVGAFLNDLPASYSLALLQYHERQQTDYYIHPFSTNRASTAAELDNFFVPAADHGASQIFDAIVYACQQMAARDEGVLPLDDADVRALIFITDGRDTSSVAQITKAIQVAKDFRVRLYPIGFGQNVNGADLLRLALESGGHYHLAPDLASLSRLFVSDTTSGGGAEGLLEKELARQLVLTYSTLFIEGQHTYLVHGDFRGLKGSFESDAVFATGGDVRAGQFALRTDGIQPDGTAVVYLRADYVPRNITQFRFRFLEQDLRPMLIERVPGGLIDSTQWLNPPDPQEGVVTLITGSLVRFYLTGDDNPLNYGTFGHLLKISISGYPAPGDPGYDPARQFDLQFWTDNRIYVDPPYTKFFQYPNVLKVGYKATRASEVPILIDSGFNPDAPNAGDADADGTPDFQDPSPH